MPVESILKSAEQVGPAARAEVDHSAAPARRDEDASLIAEALKGALADGSVEVTDAPDPAATPAEAATAQVEADVAKKAAAAAKKAEAAPSGEPSTETPATPPADTEAAKVRRDSALTAMREEKRLRDQRKAFEAEKAKHEAESKTLTERAKLADEVSSLSKNPLALLEKLGIKPDDMARALLGVKEDKPKTPAEEIAAFKAEQAAEARTKEEAAKREAEERASKQREDGQKWYQGELEKVKTLVAKGADRFELIREFGAQSRVLAVRDYVYRHGDEDQGFAQGTILTLDKCAELVETLIEADQRAKAQRSKKLAGIYGKPAQETATNSQARPSTGDKARPAPTLSNRKATPTATPSEERRVINDSDLVAEATKLLDFGKPA